MLNCLFGVFFFPKKKYDLILETLSLRKRLPKIISPSRGLQKQQINKWVFLLAQRLINTVILPQVTQHNFCDLNSTAPKGYQLRLFPNYFLWFPFLSFSSPDKTSYPHSPHFGAVPENKITAINLSTPMCVNDDGRLPGLSRLLCI